jgi:hypothetical protein
MTRKIRLILILSISILSGLNSFAQHNNSFVGVRFGVALPLGEFASQEYGYGGYALLGKSYGLEGAWFFNPKFGCGIDISTNLIGISAANYARDYRESEPSFTSVEMLSGPYKITTYMGGVYYKRAFSKKLFSTFKLMGGIFRTRTPDQFYGIKDSMIGNFTFWKTASYDTKFTFLTGTSFEYHLYEHVSLLLQADFTFTQADFTFITGNSSYVDYLKIPILRIQPGININF